MPLKRREIELSVERPLGSAPEGTVRLSARFEVDSDGAPPDPAELSSALTALREELAELVGSSAGTTHDDRDLPELVETYRPRQPELLELLREEGQLSAREYELLRGHLTAALAKPTPAPTRVDAPAPMPPAAFSTPSAATPVGPATPRAVPDLLQEYHIESLRQAGAVRARRQISFDEYMALKRHFEETPAPPASSAPEA